MKAQQRASRDPAGNRLLASLGARDREAIIAGCTRVQVDFGQVLAEPGERLSFVYFPVNCLISETALADHGSAIEIGMIGNEGMLGATIALGIDFVPMHALARGSGVALRMSAASLRRELISRPSLRIVLQKYCFVLLQQTAQAAACTHYHTLEARLAKSLLMAQDRTRGAHFDLTHQFLAKMLGVRRVGVTHAAGHLQELGLIHYHRGKVTIVDLIGLQAHSCQCYLADRRRYDRALAVGGRRALPSPVNGFAASRGLSVHRSVPFEP